MAEVPPITLDPYLAGVQAVLFGLQQAGLIPNLDPLQFVFDAFDGKPKLEDTAQAAARLEASPWWPLRALGANLMIWVRNGVPLSTGIAAYRAQLSEWLRGTISSIEPIVYGRLDPYALDHAIWLAMTSQYGDQAIVDLNNTIAQQHALGPLPVPPSTTPTLPPGIVPGTGPNDIQVSVAGDELNDIGQTLIFQLSLIYSLLTQIGSQQKPTTADTCCTNVVQSIANVVGQLSIIAAALVNPQPTAVTLDFTPVTNELTKLITAIGAYPPALQACCAAINTSLGNIANAITTTPGTDTSGIVEQLKALVREGDVKQFILNSLLQQGYITGADAQVLHGADWADSLIRIGRTALWTGWTWFLSICGVDISTGRMKVKPLASTIADDFARAINFSLGAGAAPLYPEIKGIIDGITLQLQPTGLPDIGNVKVDPDLLLAKTLSPLLIVNAVALIVDYFGWEISETLKQYTEWISEFVGLQEVRELKVGQMMRYGPMREAELRAKGTYRQEMVGLSTMASWTARGLYDPARYQGLAPLTGIPPEQVDPTMRAAYHGLGARRMMQLINTGLFSQAEIQDELTFSGIRPLSQQRMLTAAPYLATQPQRHALWATLEKAYSAGLLDDAGLTSNIDSADHNTNRDNLILQKVKWDVLIEETKGLTTEYATLFLGSVIDDPTYRSYLSGIGLQPWKVNLEASKAEARAAATLQRKTIAAAAALQRATAAEERKAAMRNFTDGNINAAALGVALVATGLTPTQAAAWVDLAALQKAGGLRWKYGLQLTAPEATLLGQRVAALTDQRKRLQISDAQYVAALQALNIPPNVINALQAAADALITPRKSAFPIPVQTG